MFLQGGPPCSCEGAYTLDTTGESVMCPACGVIWSVQSIESIFSEQEKEMFWNGEGCPDCRFQGKQR
ncbi:MAG: hypothetical protein ACPLTR_04315 [Thermacetogeniaceae bacterium]